MKVLIDSCVAGSVAPALTVAGHEVECVPDWPADPGDPDILAHARNAGQVVLTLDKDFGMDRRTIAAKLAHYKARSA